IARNVLIVVGVVLTLYLIYLLRRPLGWIVVAMFLAVALSGPVNWVQRHTGRRGLGILLTYLGLLLVPVGIGALVVPPVVTGGNDPAHNAARHAVHLHNFCPRN